ncbi:MAG: peptide chain release factor N(5)-glutamine methyltransferase [Campylobacteraceae bacterium]|nr:peptide chain release factor N(5)-glutamine methyltransferase [Campylobacteraceae bacterium]
MTIFEALKKAEADTGSKYVAKELVKFHTGLDDTKLLLSLNEELDKKSSFLLLVLRHTKGEPLEYITNKASFLDMEFYVEHGVLIPRFETEILVEKVIEVASRFENLRVCEIGVGSGIISISLKKALPNAEITATDISDTALKVAKINAKKFNADIKLVKCSLLDDVEGNFDIIVSNPPYIKDSYELDKWVLNEPKEALFGGKKGHEILEEIIKLASKRAKVLACEIGYDQKEVLSKILKKQGFEYVFYKDLAGFDRGFVASKMELFDE